METSEPRMTRQKAAGLQRFFLRSPVKLYRGPIAELLRWRCVLLLIATGRKSGEPRPVCISFMPDGDRYIVFSGWGTSSNWYRNIRANPRVTIQVGRKRMEAEARLIESPDERAALMLRMVQRSGSCGPPKLIRPVLRMTGLFDYEAELRMAAEQGGDLPVLELVPLDGQSVQS